ncbi:lipopolysaccharide biosynthesis protein [Ruegeria sp. ANG-S4]|uniref:GumC family protein n=1 Tax=Ruegeria sp. ANG-S4 TaxID=1577904 RepID=UPI00057F6858|nr:Wzz/FepE/Etk N-terminal domain-containing protein [Ruegeria sp. ANG-S4]KIC45515.1 lipopolysaccharide biosynthesis protein [Ruegeria sp. ANG-S4]
MMNEFRFYLSLFIRRIHFLLLIVICCAIAGLVVAFTAPAVYKARAQLVVESPQIPGELASTTVQASVVEILEVIQQRLLTRANLLDLSRRFNVHADQPDLLPDAIVNDMRSRIEIQLPFHSQNRASFVAVTFAAPDGETSAAVTNELVTQILQENVAMRTNATGQTLEFFVQEVARLDDELSQQGAKILQFKEAHKEALPDSLDYRRTRQSSLQERILQLDRELSGLRDRRARLVEIFDRTGRSDLAGESLTPEQRQLRQLQDERASALVIYSQDHPRIRSLEGQIAALEAANIRLGLGTETSPNITAFELQLSDIDGQINFIEEEKAIIITELGSLAKSIDATPSNAISLGTLERDYENLRLQYTQATASLAEARTGNQIEAQSRGQRITVTEQAVVPSDPAEPNRKLILAASVAGGVGLAVSLFLVLEILNNTVRRSVDLENRFGVPAFTTIPYVHTARERAMRRSLIAIGALAPIVGLGVALYLIHLHYLPIDLFVEKVAEKLGIGGLLDRFGIG